MSLCACLDEISHTTPFRQEEGILKANVSQGLPDPDFLRFHWIMNPAGDFDDVLERL